MTFLLLWSKYLTGYIKKEEINFGSSSISVILAGNECCGGPTYGRRNSLAAATHLSMDQEAESEAISRG